jgi:hypothetical protein
VVIGLAVVALVASALGYLRAPSTMLNIVSVENPPTTDFLVRTLAGAWLALAHAHGRLEEGALLSTSRASWSDSRSTCS